ncbi:MAG: hypothetical protein DMG04_27235 [Acidobacteria bacterium]|nr:MAG: hypothetical protein DMG04_27235 [Acidobacteriota bacterium]
MPPEVSIIVADASRVAAIRDGTSLPGRVMTFASASLASAIESIKAYRPKVVAIDATFAQTPAGLTFIDRVGALAIPGSTILLVVEHDGRWTTMPLGNGRTPTQSRPAAVAASHPGLVGAQIVSLPVLRPHQKINVALPDNDETMNLIAQVAWSTFEKPQPQAEPHYRVGLEFTSAAKQALEAYRQRHCADQPIPFRAR